MPSRLRVFHSLRIGVSIGLPQPSRKRASASFGVWHAEQIMSVRPQRGASWSSMAATEPHNIARNKSTWRSFAGSATTGADHGVGKAPRGGQPTVAVQFVSRVIDSRAPTAARRGVQ